MAQAALQLCVRCKRIVRGRCDCARPPERKRTNAEQRRQYCRSRWSRLRAAVLERDHHLCQDCLRAGITRIGDQVDHVQQAQRKPELFWSPDNLQTLCEICHGKKTRLEAAT